MATRDKCLPTTGSFSPIGKTEAKRRAWVDSAKYVGKVVYAHCINGYFAEDSEEVCFKKPLAVRVQKPVGTSDIEYWNGGYLDPYWGVEILERNHPDLLKIESVRESLLGSTWIDGPSYNTVDGEVSRVGVCFPLRPSKRFIGTKVPFRQRQVLS